MSTTRMAVVGCGHLGAIHSRLLAARPDVELVAVVDPVAESRERVASTHGCRPLAEPGELPGLVDAVVVAAPTGRHAAVSLPLGAEGMSRRRAFWYGQLSAVVEPIAAVIGAAVVAVAQPLLPYALSFAAGAMLFVVIEELIPESQRGGHTDLATACTIGGCVVMMVLDLALG